MSRQGNLEIELISASDLRNVELWGLKQDPYCVLSCDSNRAKSKTHTDGGKNPIWNQAFVFNSVSDSSTLTVEIFDENYFVRDVKIGVSKIGLKKVANLGYEHVQVPVYTENRQRQGFLTLELRFREVVDGHAVFRHAATSNRITQANGGDKVTDHYEFGSTLGQGTYGRIFKVCHKASGRFYACKTISKRRLSTPGDRFAVQREIDILTQLSKHPNVVTLEGVFEDAQHVCIVMELCSGGELFDRVCDLGQFTERDAAQVMRTILDVVAYCHSNGIMHRDLKPENLLLASASPAAPIKVADFGEAAYFKVGEPLFDVVGSPQYIAPEVLRRSYSQEADVWSCGVVLYVLLSGQYPFPGNNERQICEAVLRNEIDFSRHPWPCLSDSARDCTRRMLVRDPRLRPLAREMLQHEWIRQGGVASDKPIGLEVLQQLKNFSAADRFRKEAQMVIARKLPAEQIAGLHAKFKEIDSDQNGSISVQELRFALQGLNLQEAELQRILANADVNGDGTLDYQEFIAATIKLEKLNREEQFREAFEHFDLDGDGFISREELMFGLKNLPVRQANEILERVDTNGDGQIDYREFCAMMVAMG